MHELTCPSCGSAAKFNLDDKMLMCQFCSASFVIDRDSGQKEVFSDHFIVANVLDGVAVKETVLEWLRRIHHNPGIVDQEFVITELKGYSLPYWVTSLDAHTVWKGLVRREGRNSLKNSSGADFLGENGEFRRTYRWAVSGRKNLCEIWGLTRLHIPKEQVLVDWDGFPLDSTFSRGRLDEEKQMIRDGQPVKSVYDKREFFDYKYANGVPILGVQIGEEEALRRAKHHVEQYHYRLAQGSVDYLIDLRTELEITGVQLMHLPYWHCVYQYRPKSALRHFMRPASKNVLMDGSSRSVINGELALTYNDKVIVNGIVCGIAGILFFLMGAALHPAFFLISGFLILVAAASVYLSFRRMQQKASTTLDPKTAVANAWSSIS